MKSQHADEWKKASQAEYDSLMKHNVWELIALPPGKKAVGSRWTFHIKQHEYREIEWYKELFMAQGFSQKFSEDYNEIFAPVVHWESVRALIATAIQKGLVCRLKRSLYGLKQSPRCWNHILHEKLDELQFVQSKADPCLYVGKVNGETVFLAI